MVTWKINYYSRVFCFLAKSFNRDDDVRRLKEKEEYLENIRIRFRNKLLIIESYKEANKELEATIELVQGPLNHLSNESN